MENELNPSEELLRGNQVIAKFLESNKLFMVGRLGSVEADVVNLLNSAQRIGIRKRKLAWVNAGIAFPTKSELTRFSELYSKSLSFMDVAARWPEGLIENQEHLLGFASDSFNEFIPLRILDPIQSCIDGIPPESIWTQSLAKKKVLVVSPFATTIGSQLKHRQFLHQKNILPEFEVTLISPPVTNGLVFWRGSYSKNLKKMADLLKSAHESENFDVALVSAGAYGLPLMSALKAVGVSSIYMGGSLQILFGIMGNRWRNISKLSAMKTDLWISGTTENRPFGYQLIEEGSYW